MSQQGSRFNQAVAAHRTENTPAARQPETRPVTSAVTTEQQALGMTLLLEVSQHTPNLHKVADLIARGAALEMRNAHDSTPLLIAARNGHEYVADMLIQAGAYLNAQDAEGSTPLILATIAGSAKTVRHLTDKGAVLDHFNMLDRSALMWAAALGRREIAQILIRRGADLEQHNHAGQTAYDIARMHENFSLAEILKAGVRQQKDSANTRPPVSTKPVAYKDLLGKV